jgi:hypothetical protein
LVTIETVRRLVLALPEVEETASRSPGIWFGTPAFKVRGKLITCPRPEGDVLVVKVGDGYREALLETRPDTFYITPHYAGSPYLLVRMAMVEEDELRGLLVDAWRLSAPKRLVVAFDAARAAP